MDVEPSARKSPLRIGVRLVRNLVLFVAIIVLALALAVSIAGPARAATPARVWTWTPSRAEAMVVKQAKIPCANVYGPRANECDVALQRSRVTADSDPGIASSCQQRLDPTSIASCQIAAASALATAQTELASAQTGWRIAKADCTGTGTEMNFRYSRFTCKVTLQPASWERRSDSHVGTLGITVTGVSSLKWQIV